MFGLTGCPTFPLLNITQEEISTLPGDVCNKQRENMGSDRCNGASQMPQAAVEQNDVTIGGEIGPWAVR